MTAGHYIMLMTTCAKTQSDSYFLDMDERKERWYRRGKYALCADKRPRHKSGLSTTKSFRNILSSKDSPSKKQRYAPRNNYLVFIDEAGFMLNPIVRRTWAPRGCTPVIKIWEPHARISVIGAITISPKRSHFGFYFHLLKDNANFTGSSIVRFVEYVRLRIRDSIILLWDQIPIHSSKPVQEYFATHPIIRVEPFPPYAPELNPVDGVWGYVKWHRQANYCPWNLRELRLRITSEFRRLQKRSDLLEAFFNRTGLDLF